jgi:hypothetical protein
MRRNVAPYRGTACGFPSLANLTRDVFAGRM